MKPYGASKKDIQSAGLPWERDSKYNLAYRDRFCNCGYCTRFERGKRARTVRNYSSHKNAAKRLKGSERTKYRNLISQIVGREPDWHSQYTLNPDDGYYNLPYLDGDDDSDACFGGCWDGFVKTKE